MGAIFAAKCMESNFESWANGAIKFLIYCNYRLVDAVNDFGACCRYKNVRISPFPHINGGRGQFANSMPTYIQNCFNFHSFTLITAFVAYHLSDNLATCV